MAKQALNIDELTQSIASSVAAQLGMVSSPKLLDSLASLIDIKKILTKLIDPNKTVQADQKLPTVLTKTFDTISKSSKKETPLSEEAEAETTPSLLEKKEEPKPFLFAGFTPNGLTALAKELPEIIKTGMSGFIKQAGDKKDNKDNKEGGFQFPGLGIIKGALGVLSILGGIFTLLYGLQTEGPFKGLAKLAGKGMLEIGKILTKPLVSFISNISNFLLETPLKMIKSFGSTLKGFMGKIASTAKVGISKLLSPITSLMKSIGERLIAVPMKLINSFGKSIGGLFGKVGGDVAKVGLGKLTGFLPNLLKGMTGFLKKIPFVGSLITLGYAVSRFKSGDYVGGGIEILSGIAGLFPGIGTGISLAIDGLNAFLDMKAGGASGKQTKAKLDILGGMGKWVVDKLKVAPIIGPLVKAVEHFASGEWIKGLKQLAYTNPAFEMIGAMLGDNEAGSTTKAVAGMATNWIGEMSSWIGTKLTELPIIGPSIKAVQAIYDGNWSEAFKHFAHINPVIGLIESFLNTDAGASVASAATDMSNKAADMFSGMKTSILTKILEYVPETVFGYPLRAKVAELFGIGPATIDPAASPETAAASHEKPTESTPVKQVGDAQIKPDGGLVVSSPTEGSLFQMSKNDGIIAVPMSDGESSIKQNNSSSFDKAESILEKIANNTGLANGNLTNLIAGFNNLAKALKDSGTISQAPVVNNIVTGRQQLNQGPSPIALANAGNKDIFNFRNNIVESSRFQPA